MWEMDYDAAARYWDDKSTAAPLMITGELKARIDKFIRHTAIFFFMADKRTYVYYI